MREPKVGDIWSYNSYSDKTHYLILRAERKEEKHSDSDGTPFTTIRQYYDILGLEDGKTYTDYTCGDMGNHSGWRFIC